MFLIIFFAIFNGIGAPSIPKTVFLKTNKLEWIKDHHQQQSQLQFQPPPSFPECHQWIPSSTLLPEAAVLPERCFSAPLPIVEEVHQLEEPSWISRYFSSFSMPFSWAIATAASFMTALAFFTRLLLYTPPEVPSKVAKIGRASCRERV